MSVQISGGVLRESLQDFERVIRTLLSEQGGVVGRAAMIEALKESAQPLVPIIQQRTPVRTGKLRQSVKIARGRGRRNRHSVDVGYRLTRGLRLAQAKGIEYGNRKIETGHDGLRAATEAQSLVEERFIRSWRPAVNRIVQRAARRRARSA